MMNNIFLKRVYEPYDDMDGCRILIDRLWPRGISKESARLSFWFKDIAPSNELRKWFCHKPELFNGFRKQYLNELQSDEQKRQMIEQIIDLSTKDRVTLLYGAKDPVYNHGVVLFEELKGIVNH
ncbi:uncharacterized protein YeaO (DUF488 family) [Bacillus sp. SLBN-46]|uniref:DUF488 domain-containing protein n=1 Tax=Bacillus sp. SLBN-46 TaxID=3042283 RepID=UPI002865EAF7|nr:uncharacterized protein YeaO (DUF488 family) [Bacillus sp. SLBN-46]